MSSDAAEGRVGGAADDADDPVLELDGQAGLGNGLGDCLVLVQAAEGDLLARPLPRRTTALADLTSRERHVLHLVAEGAQAAVVAYWGESMYPRRG